MIVSSTQAESGRQPLERHGATPRPNAPPPLDHTPRRNPAPRKAGRSRRPPESSPPVAGGSSYISKERPSRLLAGTSRSRAAVRRLAAGLLLVVAGLLGVSAAAQAQTTYVSNIGQTVSGSDRIVGSSGAFQFTQAQPFTTGDNTDGYTLSEVVVKVGPNATPTDVPRVSIYSNSSGNPGTSLYTLTNPVSFASGNMIFPAPANATLAKETDYFVVFEETVDDWLLKTTQLNGVDTAESGWGIGDTHAWRNSDAGAWSSNDNSLLITIKGTLGGTTTTDTPVTIEAEHESIGAGLEDLVFTLTREGDTTDALPVTVTITQAQSWLSNLEYTVTFPANSANAELTITASNFSFTPSTTGALSAVVSGDGIDGGSDTVAVISTSAPPITIGYDMPDYTFAENATDAAVYLVATLDAAYPREPSRNYFVTFSTRFGTAEDDEDYVPISERETFTRSEYGRTAETDPFVARKLLSDFGFAIVDDAIYEGSERLDLIIEPDPTHVAGMVVFQKPDGTTCEPFGDCPNPLRYPVTITDEGDLPALLLSVAPASIDEEDDDGTTSVAENVSTVTVGITNGKTFAVDKTATLTFSGTATQGTHYSVNPGDADSGTGGHQVVLRTGDSSVEVTVTATGNDTADGPRTVTVKGTLGAKDIDTKHITILDDEDTNTSPTFTDGADTSRDFNETIGDETVALPANIDTPVEATDTDTGDTLTYSLEGADAARFGIVSTSGQLRTKVGESYSYEARTSYAVTVKVEDGALGSDTIDVTLNVTDQNEPPMKPDPPMVSATTGSTTSLDVSWTAPTNAGRPDITSYDLQYQQDMETDWIDGPENQTVPSASIGSLEAGTAYRVQVRATNAEGDSVWSNSGPGSTNTTTTAPEIVTGGVQVTSTPMATGDTYGLGETIKITVTFDKAVTVDTSGGTPRIQFRLGPPRDDKWAEYRRGSGGTALVFTYTVQADDMDADGIWLPADILQLRSGTIRAAADTTVDATLTYAEPGLQSGHKVDGSLTTNPRPAIVTGGVQVTSTPATGDTYGLGETIAITVTFDKAVTVDTSGGTRRPGIAFRLDGDLNPNRWAGYSRGSGGTALVFTYMVQAGDMDDDGIRLPANAIELFRGTIRDATDTIVDATLTYAQPGIQSGHKVDGSLTTTTNEDDGTDEDDGTTTTPPVIVTGGVQVTSTPMATGDTYGLGETIAITVTFDKAVTVDTSGGTRRPGIAFRLDGDLNPNRWAGYSSGSGGTALVFTYMVQAGDMDDDGIWLAANAIELFRGTIRDATDTIVDATLTYARPGIQSGHKVDGSLTTTTNEDDGTDDDDGTMDDDDGTTSPPTGTGGGGGGGGSSGPSLTVPGAPTNLMAVGGDGQVVLTWEAPASDGGTAITDYEVRINQTGEWISIGSTDTTHAVTGLVNGTAYAFQVRAVNAAGSSAPSNQTEATPELFTLDFAHFANGEGITSGLVFVNVATHPIRLGLEFYDKEGNPIAAETVVDVTEDLEIMEDGSLSVRTAMEPLGELTISTHGRGGVVSGSVKVVSNGPIGGVLRFDLPGIGVAGVGASPPVRDALFPARREGGGISTAAAVHNIEEEAITVSCRLMSGGMVLEAVEIDLEANGQEARYIEELFTATDTSDFVGSVRCTAPGLFTGIAVELDAGNRIFTTLPVVPVARAGGGGQETVLYFAHFANGGGTTSDLVFVNVSPRPSGPGPTPYHAAVSPSRPALYFYDQEGNLMDPASVVDLTGDLEITGDGALSIQTEMEPLGELTISTHGRGELVSGSVTVVSEGPIGGVLRYALPGIGVTGVGSSPPVRDALFPVRQEGGLDTAAAIRNLTESDLVVTCRLMKDGAVLEETQIPLAANGQEARYIEEMFTFTDVSDFVGSVRCTVPPGEAMFTGVAVELDAGNRIFTTLPVVPVTERMSQE